MSEDKALATQGETTPATAEELQAYEESVVARQQQSFPAKYNQIKIWYDDERPEMVGKYVKILEGTVIWETVGDSFKGTILAKRHMYSYYNENDDTDKMYTSQFEEWGDEVTVHFKGLKDKVKGISKWKKENYPDATYFRILYVLVDTEVYVVRVKGASCKPYFDFEKSLDKGKTPFSFETEFGHTKDKKGNVTFYPMSFKKLKDHKTEDYQILLQKSFETNNAINALAKEEESIELSPEQQEQAAADIEEVFNEDK